MNKQEFSKIAATLKACYSKDSFLPDAVAMTVWYEALKDIDYETAKKAAMAHVKTSPYPPTISDLRKRAVDAVSPKSDWSDGWGQVRKAIGAYGMWDEKGAIESLDHYTAETVKRMGWQSICSSENAEVTRAQFRQVYELVSSREKEQLCLAEGVQLLSNLKMLKGEEHESD